MTRRKSKPFYFGEGWSAFPKLAPGHGSINWLKREGLPDYPRCNHSGCKGTLDKSHYQNPIGKYEEYFNE